MPDQDVLDLLLRFGLCEHRLVGVLIICAEIHDILDIRIRLRRSAILFPIVTDLFFFIMFIDPEFVDILNAVLIHIHKYVIWLCIRINHRRLAKDAVCIPLNPEDADRDIADP